MAIISEREEDAVTSNGFDHIALLKSIEIAADGAGAQRLCKADIGSCGIPGDIPLQIPIAHIA